MAGLPFHALEPAQPARLEHSSRALQLRFRDSAIAQRSHLRPQRAQRITRALGWHLGAQYEDAELGPGERAGSPTGNTPYFFSTSSNTREESTSPTMERMVLDGR